MQVDSSKTGVGQGSLNRPTVHFGREREIRERDAFRGARMAQRVLLTVGASNIKAVVELDSLVEVLRPLMPLSLIMFSFPSPPSLSLASLAQELDSCHLPDKQREKKVAANQTRTFAVQLRKRTRC